MEGYQITATIRQIFKDDFKKSHEVYFSQKLGACIVSFAKTDYCHSFANYYDISKILKYLYMRINEMEEMKAKAEHPFHISAANSAIKKATEVLEKCKEYKEQNGSSNKQTINQRIS